MSARPLLFPELPKVPAARRRMLAHAHPGEVGELDVVVPGKTCIANFICSRCGWDEWVPATETEARRGIPCPVCERETAEEGAG